MSIWTGASEVDLPPTKSGRKFGDRLLGGRRVGLAFEGIGKGGGPKVVRASGSPEHSFRNGDFLELCTEELVHVRLSEHEGSMAEQELTLERSAQRPGERPPASTPADPDPERPGYGPITAGAMVPRVSGATPERRGVRCRPC